MGWRERTVSSNIMFILAFFRIIPSFKYKWLDRIALLVYVLATCAIGFSTLYLEMDGILQLSTTNLTAAETFSLIAVSVSYPLQLIPIIPLIYFFIYLNKSLLIEQKLPLPLRVITFLAYNILQVISSLYLLYVYGLNSMYSSWSKQLVLFSIMLGYMILKMVSTFVVGSAISLIHRKLQDEFPSRSLNFQNHLYTLIGDFVGLKKGLEPLLFITFVTQTTILSSTLFMVFALKYWAMILFALCLMLDLVYISFVLDDCYGSFKSLVLRLRQCGADKEEGIDVIIYIIEAEQPFTAYGFFNVDRSLLSSIFGTILTYLIILLQYK